MTIGEGLASGNKSLHAAGGVLMRQGNHGPSIAIIFRNRYKEWALPKGKLEEGESLLQAALREVREETGYMARPLHFLGSTSYRFEDRPKTVYFWAMEPIGRPKFEPSEEVARVEWLPIDEAIHRLDHPEERDLVAKLQTA